MIKMDQDRPLVSIGLTTYNRPKFLRNALECLTTQTYSNLEIIVSDDCSPGEETQKVVKEFMEKDPRIHFYRQEKNLTLPVNNLFVFEKATGEYFIWADDDDEWEKKFVETGVQALLKHPQYAAWCCSAYNIDSYGRVIRKLPRASRFSTTQNKKKDIIKYLFEPEGKQKANLFHSVFRRDALAQVCKAYVFKGTYASDICLILAFLTRFDLLATDDVLLYKREIRPTDNEAQVHHLHPHVSMFPIGKTIEYIREHYTATRTTPYKNLVLLTMLLRVPLAIRNEWLSKRGINKVLGKFGYRIIKIKDPETPQEF